MYIVSGIPQVSSVLGIAMIYQMKPFFLRVEVRLVHQDMLKLVKRHSSPDKAKLSSHVAEVPFYFSLIQSCTSGFLRSCEWCPLQSFVPTFLTNKHLIKSADCRHKTLQAFQVQSGVLRSQSVETAQVLGNCLDGRFGKQECQGWGKRIPTRWNSKFPLHRSQHTGNWTL